MEELKLKVECFNLKDTVTCGQCFRWKEYQKENQYIGVIKDRVIKIRQENEYIYVSSNKKEELEGTVKKYFDLNVDYQAIEDEISKIDEKVKRAVKATAGIRILNQDLYETIVSYIISANNNIPKIQKSIGMISEKYGEKVLFEGQEYFLFPENDRLKLITQQQYRECIVGFRDRYLISTVNKILNNEIDISDLNELSNKEAKKKLMTLMGIGSKVADCIMLFAMDRKDVFPIDVWVKRVMEELYFNRATSLNEIEKYAEENFGKYSGIVQQHLFHSIRNNLLEG